MPLALVEATSKDGSPPSACTAFVLCCHRRRPHPIDDGFVSAIEESWLCTQHDFGAIGKPGGRQDGARNSTGGVHVPLDQSTSVLNQETSATMAGFRNNPFSSNVMQINDVM
jgi:hypothetical protein